MRTTRFSILAWTSAPSLFMVVAFTAQCNLDDQGVVCQLEQPNSCQQPSMYCAQAGQCVACPAGSLNCDGDNANQCEDSNPTCAGSSCQGCTPPSCCQDNQCFQHGQTCKAQDQTCVDGTCRIKSNVCGNVFCAAPSCCHNDVCYKDSEPCGASGLTCNSGTCSSANMCGSVLCGPPSCCHNDLCYQHGQVCGGGLTCSNGTCVSPPCGGGPCDAPSCCFNNVCYPDGQPCGGSGLTCSGGTCGAGPAWNCTIEPGGGPFTNPHADGCKWRWICPAEGDRELYCDTVSTAEHTCSCKKDGSVEKQFTSTAMCTYTEQTIAAQVNAECGWNLPTP